MSTNRNDLISRNGVSAWLDNMGHRKLSDYIMDEKRFPSINPEELIRRVELILITEGVELTLITEGQHDLKFKLGEYIKYTPAEVSDILRKHADELLP